ALRRRLSSGTAQARSLPDDPGEVERHQAVRGRQTGVADPLAVFTGRKPAETCGCSGFGACFGHRQHVQGEPMPSPTRLLAMAMILAAAMGNAAAQTSPGAHPGSTSYADLCAG